MLRKDYRNQKAKKNYVVLSASAAMLFAAFVLVLTNKQPLAAVTTEQILVAEFDTVKIPVPLSSVAQGTPAGQIDFAFIEMPKHQVPAGTITHLSEIDLRVTNSALTANTPMFTSNFIGSDQSYNPVIKSIPDGMRAMTIRVDATSAVEGWAGSGSTIDVLLVEKDRTTVVAENVKILSAERSVAPVTNTGGSPNIPSTVTLLVSQQQCLAINTAIPRGKIAFALRNVSDHKDWQRKHFTADHLNRDHQKSQGTAQAVSGYLEVKGESGKKMILSNGKWLNTPAKPEGYFINQD